MKHLKKQSSILTVSTVFLSFIGVVMQPLNAQENLSGTAGGVVVPAYEPQPSVQSSGLPIDVLGIPTGNDATSSPLPDVNSNRCGPGIVLGFGQIVYDQIDLSIKGRDEVTNLVVARRHLSRRDHTKVILLGSETNDEPLEINKHSLFGPAWAFNYSHTITRYGDDVFMYSFGRRDLFEKVKDGVWEGTEGRFGRLTYDDDASTYTLRMPHGTILEFTADHSKTGKPAHLTKIISPNTSNTLQFNYESISATPILERKLLSITDSFSRSITFTYADSDYPQGVSSITDFSDRTVQYDYNSDGQLLSARSPTVTSTSGLNDFSSGKTHTYQYLNSNVPVLKNALTAVIFPNQVVDQTNIPRYQWTYEASIGSSSTTNSAGASPSRYLGYVKSFTMGEKVLNDQGAPTGEGTFSYTYRALASSKGADSNRPLREVKVKDRMGTETVYNTNRLGQVLLEEVKTKGLRSGEPKSYAKSFQYNSDGQLTQMDDETGSRTQYFYTNRRDIDGSGNGNNPRNVEFPMTDIVRLPDSKGAQQEYIRSRIVYEPIYNKPFQTIDPRGFEGLSEGTSETEIAAKSAKYTTTHYYDYMEDWQTQRNVLSGLLGISDATSLFPDATSFLTNSAELNGNGDKTQKAGNVIKIQYPDVTVTDLSNVDETALGAAATAFETFQYNTFGQLIRRQDAELNVTTYSYFTNGTPSSGDSGGGGYLKETIRDAVAGGDSTNPINQTTIYEYGQQTVQLEANSGTTATFPANPRGIPTATIDPRGVKTTYLINELDQVIKTVRASADVSGVGGGSDIAALAYESMTLYDANDNVIETCVENEGSITVDASSSSVENIDDLIVTRYTYDLLDQITSSVRDEDLDESEGESAIKTVYTYDENQNIIGTNQGDSSTAAERDEFREEETIYDERDFIIEQIVGKGEEEEAIFERTIDADGKITMIIDGEDKDGDAGDAADGAVGGDVTRIVYDGFDRKQEVIDRVGNRTTYKYDSASNIINVKNFGRLGESGSETLLSESETKYDERNRVIQADRKLYHYQGQSVGEIHDVDEESNDGVVSRYTLYDGLNRTVAVVDEEKGLEQTFYDGLSRPIKIIDEEGSSVEFTYDLSSNVIKTKEIEKEDSDDNTPTEFISEKTYDALNRPIESKEPNGEITTFEYDSRNNLIRTIDALENKTEMAYDRLNRVIKEETFLSQGGENSKTSVELRQGGGDGKITLQYEWDDLGRQVSKIDDNDARVDYIYDDLGRKIKATYADDSTEEWTYNDDGEVTEYKDRNGTTISKTYDAKSRLIHETFATDPSSGLERKGTTERSWVYDGLNRLVKTFDNNNPDTPADDVTYFYTYDSLSRVIRETQRIGDNINNDLNIDTEWEGSSDRKVVSIYPNGRKIVRTYDDMDRLSKIEEKTTSTSLIASFLYDGPSRTIGATYGNGAVLTKVFDNNKRATQTKWMKGTNVITDYVNTYNATNRRVSENRLHLGSGNFDSYTFDSDYRMTGFREDGTATNDGGIVSTRTLSGADMMLEFSDDGVNRGLKVDGDGTSDTVGYNGEVKLNRYTTVDAEARIYDANGSLDDTNTNDSTDADDLEFVQDYLSRIVEVEKGDDSPLASYIYDAKGRRVLKTVGSTVTRYLYDDWQVVEERDNSNNVVLRQYVDGRELDEHIQMRVFQTSGEPSDYYYHCNDQGFVGALTDSSGAVVEYYEYEWLGEVKVLNANKIAITDPDSDTPGIESPVGNPYSFQGRRLDPETGLYYYRHRYYNPDLGNFLTIDPLGVWNHGQGNGTSAFAEDPLNNRDPYGLDLTLEQKEGVKTAPNKGMFWSGTSFVDVPTVLKLMNKRRPFLTKSKRNSWIPEGQIVFGDFEDAIWIAKQRSLTTLEMLERKFTQRLTPWNDDPAVQKDWNALSGEYALNISGEIRASLANNVRPGNVWQKTELPRLISKNNDWTKIFRIDPLTLKEEVILEKNQKTKEVIVHNGGTKWGPVN